MAEVRFRILFAKVRTMLIDASLPKQFWTFAFRVAVYTYNRTLCQTTNCTPFELWLDYPPDVSNLRWFGCLCYALVPNTINMATGNQQKRKKLDVRSIRGIFVGYAPNQKGWCVLDCTTGTVITTCHVTFDESGSPSSEELKRQELNKLARFFKLDFDYYSRTAVTDTDYMFYSGAAINDKPSSSDILLLDDFVRSFDMASVNISTFDSALLSYAPRAHALVVGSQPQGATRTPANPILKLIRTQQEAEATVSIENMQRKHEESELADTHVSDTPKSYAEVMISQDRDKWLDAIAKEGDSLKENKTWTLVEKPRGKRILSTMWVLKIKYKSDGSIERYKARLVVRGCHQKEGIDFTEIFAPVVRLESLRVLLAIACIEDLECEQMDIETAFLNGECTEEVYIEQPEGLKEPGKEHLVCKLVKSLYGLKQAPRAWHKALTDFLKSIGFKKLFCESCIYVRFTNDEKEIIAIYVDDLLILAKSKSNTEKIKQQIGNRFKAKDLGAVKFLLGLQVTRDRMNRKMWIKQENFIANILKKFNLSHCNPVDTPTHSQVKLEKIEITESMKEKPYR
jgi:hypothetical protein